MNGKTRTCEIYREDTCTGCGECTAILAPDEYDYWGRVF